MNDSNHAWKAFATCALPLFPVLIRQMTAVTEQTEKAALNLMTTLQAIAQRASRQAAEDLNLTQMERPRASLSQSKQPASELSSDVGQIVMALQFQDITRQKLEHVQHALTHLRDHLQRLVDGKPDQDLEDSLSFLKDLEHSYTMESERRIHGAASADSARPAAVPPGQAGSGDDSVTLF
jgi:chemotaxis regulatin CheY-phosphate phosphatase CheZ